MCWLLLPTAYAERTEMDFQDNGTSQKWPFAFGFIAGDEVNATSSHKGLGIPVLGYSFTDHILHAVRLMATTAEHQAPYQGPPDDPNEGDEAGGNGNRF